MINILSKLTIKYIVKPINISIKVIINIIFLNPNLSKKIPHINLENPFIKLKIKPAK